MFETVNLDSEKLTNENGVIRNNWPLVYGDIFNSQGNFGSEIWKRNGGIGGEIGG